MTGTRIDLGSTRLAFFLIAALAVLIIISAVIPQRGIAEDQMLDWQAALGERYVVIERLGLDRIYLSPTFFVVLGLLAINLIVGNLRRFRTVLRVERTLLKARHIGSIVFHLSLLLIIAAVILNYLYKFQGIYGLTEGQTARDEPHQYYHLFTGPLYGDPFGRFEISLEEVHEMGEIEDVGTECARIGVRDPEGRPTDPAIISINHPFVWDDLEFHFGPRIGYSPELVVEDNAGAGVFRGFVRLASRRTEGREIHEDFVMLPVDSLRVRLSVRPDSSRASEPERHLAIERGADLLYEGVIAPDDTISAAELRLRVPRLRRWCYVDVVKNPFLDFVFVGFWSALGGLAISALARMPRSRRRST